MTGPSRSIWLTLGTEWRRDSRHWGRCCAWRRGDGRNVWILFDDIHGESALAMLTISVKESTGSARGFS